MEHMINGYVSKISHLETELTTIKSQENHSSIDEGMLIKENEILNERITDILHRI